MARYIVECSECGKQMKQYAVNNIVDCPEGQRPTKTPKADTDRCEASSDRRHKPKWVRA